MQNKKARARRQKNIQMTLHTNKTNKPHKPHNSKPQPNSPTKKLSYSIIILIILNSFIPFNFIHHYSLANIFYISVNKILKYKI